MLPDQALARRCPHGYIKRVRLGVCVSKRSRLARGVYVAVRLPRHAPLAAHERPSWFVEIWIPAEAESPPTVTPDPLAEPQLPQAQSRMLTAPPAEPFNLLSPEHQ
jgi:hypothetical protein